MSAIGSFTPTTYCLPFAAILRANCESMTSAKFSDPQQHRRRSPRSRPQASSALRIRPNRAEQYLPAANIDIKGGGAVPLFLFFGCFCHTKLVLGYTCLRIRTGLGDLQQINLKRAHAER